MKKGKNLLLVSGIFDILFALGLFALIILYFFRMDYVSQLTLSVWSIISMLIYVPFSYIQIIHYSVLGFLGLVGLLSLIFGSVSIARVRNDQKRYYHKGGRLIAFVVLETIALAERDGFEPSVAFDNTGFRDRHIRPLWHLSVIKMFDKFNLF